MSNRQGPRSAVARELIFSLILDTIFFAITRAFMHKMVDGVRGTAPLIIACLLLISHV